MASGTVDVEVGVPVGGVGGAVTAFSLGIVSAEGLGEVTVIVTSWGEMGTGKIGEMVLGSFRGLVVLGADSFLSKPFCPFESGADAKSQGRGTMAAGIIQVAAQTTPWPLSWAVIVLNSKSINCEM